MLLLTYVAGPYPDAEQHSFLKMSLEDGGCWLGLHSTSGGKAAPVDGDRHVRKTLGAFFLNHPPVRKFRVDVADPHHVLTRGLPLVRSHGRVVPDRTPDAGRYVDLAERTILYWKDNEFCPTADAV